MKHVYLASSQSDVTSSNVFTDFQSAYNEANSIQKETSERVVIIVVNTKIETVGNLTLTENWNTSIELQGSGIEESAVGSIIATNKKGNGYSVGTMEVPCVFNQVRIGNIITSAIGTYGDSGCVGIMGHAFRIGNINTSIQNPKNITGNGGDVSYTNTPENAGYVNDITTTSLGALTKAGDVRFHVKGACSGNITTAMGTHGGNIMITDALVVGVITQKSKSGTVSFCRIKKLQGVDITSIASHSEQSFLEFLKVTLRKIINFFKKK